MFCKMFFKLHECFSCAFHESTENDVYRLYTSVHFCILINMLDSYCESISMGFPLNVKGQTLLTPSEVGMLFSTG